MHKGLLITGALLAGLGVILGAFAAHKLKQMVAENALTIFETGVRYLMYHAFAIIIAGWLFRPEAGIIKLAGVFFVLGIILFSGSLFLITYKQAAMLPGMKWVGPVTPVGGLFFIAGWILLAIGIARLKF